MATEAYKSRSTELYGGPSPSDFPKQGCGCSMCQKARREAALTKWTQDEVDQLGAERNFLPEAYWPDAPKGFDQLVESLAAEQAGPDFDREQPEDEQEATESSFASTNPKKRMGMKKPPVHLVPDSAIVHIAMAFKDGAAKYGPFNWREDPVDVTTYVAAARRHLAQFMSGEQCALDSGVHHLAHAGACIAILLDAETSGTLIDDRPLPQDLSGLIDRLTTKAA